jgi:hypothetical protein
MKKFGNLTQLLANAEPAVAINLVNYYCLLRIMKNADQQEVSY